jgi:hypothetical protein
LVTSSVATTTETSFFFPFLAALNKALAGYFSDEPVEKSREGSWTVMERVLSFREEPGPFLDGVERSKVLVLLFLTEEEWVRFSSNKAREAFLGGRVL